MKGIETTRNSRGAVAPLVAVMLILIIVCVALVVDLGHVHNVKVQLQRAVDAAALAAAEQLPDGNAVSVAVAVAGANQVDQEGVTILPADVVLGIWDKNIVAGATAATRFTPLAAGGTPNAVKVTATRDVRHIFFFFVESTPVTTDAIAVATPEVPILPVAIVTCIPAESMLENPGSLPDMDVCGITTYKFTNDQNDTAAWTSLTFGANANEIADYMTTDEGQDKFNKVVFGRDLPNTDGIENESVDSGASSFNSNYAGCPDSFPYDFNITCGLGKIAGKDLAPPGEFPSPSPPNLTQNAQGIYLPNLPFDPLTAYGTNGALPRWYNLNNNSSFDSADHFTRVWAQDGILLKGSSESNQAYVNRLGTLANCPAADPSCKPYGDDRFRIIGNTENFITEPIGQFAANLEDTLGFTPSYWPDFLKVVKHAGYPKVGLINGNTATVLQAFVENPDVTDGINLRATENEPFPPGEKTLRVTAPVIFAGACENWQAISNAATNQEFRYIGLAKLLITRVWVKNGESYDCGENSEVVQLHSGAGCSASDFDPPLQNGAYFSVPVAVHPSLKAIEALQLVPVEDDEEGTTMKVFLVE